MTEAVDVLRKSMDWFLYDNGLLHERVKSKSSSILFYNQAVKLSHETKGGELTNSYVIT